jgi:multiple sugar transport system substrate-binding protein
VIQQGELMNKSKALEQPGVGLDSRAGGSETRTDQEHVFVWSFAVPSASKNKQWAFEFIQPITSKEWVRRSMEKGNASARLSVLTDPEIVEA